MFKCSLTFEISTIRGVVFPWWFIKSSHMWFRPNVSLFLWYNITHLFHINFCPTLTPHTLEYLSIWKNYVILVTLFLFQSSTNLPIRLHIPPCHTSVLFCWSVSHNYITYQWFHTTCGWHTVWRFLVNIWGDDDNIIILDVGILLLFWTWVVLVRCNGHNVIKLLFMNMFLVPVSYWYLY